MKFGVNIDHIATLRQARRGFDPDPVDAVSICEKAGADSIVAHLREDRRHIQDLDLLRLKRKIKTRFNLEMSIAPEIVKIALKIKPHQVTLVPERRQEITTEGGLDAVRYLTKIKAIVQKCKKAKIDVSLFIAPDRCQVDASLKSGASMVEFHTGCYANAKTQAARRHELNRLTAMTQYATTLGLIVNAGHGLNYQNVKPIARIKGMQELNIGHSVISRAVFVGLDRAVREMKQLMD